MLKDTFEAFMEDCPVPPYPDQKEILYNIFVNEQDVCREMPAQAGKTVTCIIAAYMGALIIEPDATMTRYAHNLYRDFFQKDPTKIDGLTNIISGSISGLSGIRPKAYTYLFFDESLMIKYDVKSNFYKRVDPKVICELFRHETGDYVIDGDNSTNADKVLLLTDEWDQRKEELRVANKNW